MQSLGHGGETIAATKSRFIISLIVAVVFILSGLAVGTLTIILPNLSQWHQDAVIEQYNQELETMPSEALEERKEEARSYNETGRSNVYFAGDTENVVSYIDIPKIKTNLPIFNGTSDEILEKGIGILEGTSLPIGGKGTHCVLTGHSGIAHQKLFTNLSELKAGDIFYLNTLGEKLAYKVYDTRIVLPEEVSNNIVFSKEHDFCTLMTCTPISLNKHRLLILAERTFDIPDETELSTNTTGQDEPTSEPSDSLTESQPTDPSSLLINQQEEYKARFEQSVMICGALSVVLIISGIVIIVILIAEKRKKHKS